MPTICPIALAVGCRRCPVFKVCPVKGVIGDYRGGAAEPPATPARPKRAGEAKHEGKSARPGRKARSGGATRRERRAAARGSDPARKSGGV
jgi:hypothetical protein